MRKKAIYILGGGLRKDENGGWRSADFGEEGISGRSEANGLRVNAAFYCYKEDPDILLISSGGAGGNYKNIPGIMPVGEVMKGELMELGAPLKNIAVENESNNTYEQLKKLGEIIETRSLENVVIISNEYHLPRIIAMIENAPELAGINQLYKNSNIRLQSAEEIVMRFDPNKWSGVIEAAYKSDSMKARIKSEEAGAAQIKNGTYKL